MEVVKDDVLKIIRQHPRWSLGRRMKTKEIVFSLDDISFRVFFNVMDLTCQIRFPRKIQFMTQNGEKPITWSSWSNEGVPFFQEHRISYLFFNDMINEATSSFPFLFMWSGFLKKNDTVAIGNPNVIWNDLIPGTYNKNDLALDPQPRPGSYFFNMWCVIDDIVYTPFEVSLSQDTVSCAFSNIPDDIMNGRKIIVYLKALSEPTYEVTEIIVREWGARNFGSIDEYRPKNRRGMSINHNKKEKTLIFYGAQSLGVKEYVLEAFKKYVYPNETEIITIGNQIVPVDFCATFARVVNTLLQWIFEDDKTYIEFNKKKGFLTGENREVLGKSVNFILPPRSLRHRILRDTLSRIYDLKEKNTLDLTTEELAELIRLLQQFQKIQSISYIESCVLCGTEAQWKTKDDDTKFCSKGCAKKYYQ